MRLLILSAFVLAACGIPTAPPAEVSGKVEEAAIATSELEQYAFSWSADYRLDSSAEVTSLRVIGSGLVDATSGDVEAIVTYDEAVRPRTERLFPGTSVETISAETRVVGGDVFVRGLNAAFAGDEALVQFDIWYRVTAHVDHLNEPFVNNEVRPADVLPVLLEPLSDDEIGAVEVERDFILDLGTRFPGSLFDFGLRIGGGNFEISAERVDGIIRSVRIDGDDAEIGVNQFTFEIEFEPLDTVTITAPPGAVTYP